MLFSSSEIWPLFSGILISLVPVYALFSLGFGLRICGFASVSIWDGLDRIVFWVLFPIFLFHRTVNAEFAGAMIEDIALSLGGTILFMASLAWMLKHLLRLPAPSYVALYQAAFRLNIYVAIAVCEALFGAEGVTIAALATAITAPLMNAVALFELIGLQAKTLEDGDTTSKRTMTLAFWARVLKGIALNPLVIACCLGGAANFFGAKPSGAIEETLSIAANAALPLALMGVGAGLRVEAITRAMRAVSIACFLKLILAPLIALGLVSLLSVSGSTAFICVLFAAMPTSASAYQMTKNLGGDGKLMAALITAQTLLTPLTAPVLLAFAGLALSINLS